MKSIIYSILALSMTIVISGCGGVEAEAEDHAEEMCECLTEAGLNSNISFIKLQDREYMRELEDKMQEEVPPCLLKVLKEMNEEMDEMSKKEKKAYTKAFLKSAIDTDCADIALDLVPYDMLGRTLEQVEKSLEYQQERRERRESRRELEELEDLFV